MAARARRWAGEVFRYAIATGRWHRRPSYRAQGRSQSRADRTLSSSPLFLGGHKRVPYMSENTLNKAIEVIGYKGRVVGHGFRATASTILNESGQFAPDVIERQLAHAERNKVGAAYHRAEYLAERTKLMQFWANELDRLVLGAEVVQLPQRA